MSFEEFHKYDGYDVEIKFDFHIGVPAVIVTSVIEVVESVIFDFLEEDISHVSRELAEHFTFEERDVYELLNSCRGRSLLITGAKKGSVVLEAAVASLAVWVFANTIGESFKEAWKNTSTHKKIKEYLNNSFVNRHEDIQKNIRRKLHGDSNLNSQPSQITIEITDGYADAGKLKIKIVHDLSRLELLGKGYD